MKKSTFYLVLLFATVSILPNHLMAAEKEVNPISAPAKELPAEVKLMVNRIEEIKAMDKSDLSSSERKELRKEVRSLKSQVRASGHGGIYLSVGAIIIVALVLILIL